MAKSARSIGLNDPIGALAHLALGRAYSVCLLSATIALRNPRFQ